MSKVSTNINFVSGTEEAFNFYKSVFGGDFTSLLRWSQMPEMPGAPTANDEDKNKIMHTELPILGGHVLMGADTPESMRANLTPGNNIQITLEPDTKEEADRLLLLFRKEEPFRRPWRTCSGEVTTGL